KLASTTVFWPASCSSRDAHNEEAELVRLCANRELIDNQSAASLDCNTGKSHGRNIAHRLQSDHRKVGLAILHGLWRLGQNASPPRRGAPQVFRQCRDACDHGISALCRLDRQSEASTNHGSLADIEFAKRTNNLEG